MRQSWLGWIWPRRASKRTVAFEELPPAPRPQAWRPILIFVAATAGFMEGVDSTFILTALPKIAESFNTNIVSVSVGLTAYLLIVAVLTPASGWLSDRFSGRKIFVLSVAIFSAASFLCGISDNLLAFTLARMLQGVGGGWMTAAARLLLLRNTPKERLARAINWMTVPMLLGPVIGGYCAEYWTWRWAFFVNLPVGGLGLILALKLLPKDVGEHRPFDFAGFFLNGLSLACLVYGLQTLSDPNSRGPWGWLLLVFTLPVGWTAIWHARRASHPLIPLTPFRLPSFFMVTLTGGNIVRLGMMMAGFFMPLMFQLALGMDAATSGLLLLMLVGTDVAMKSLTTSVIERFGLSFVARVSLLSFAVMHVALSAVPADTGFWLIAMIMVAMGATRSFHLTSLLVLQFIDVPQDNMTAASTLAILGLQAFRAVAIALAALLLNGITLVVGGSAEHPTLITFRVALLILGLLIASSFYWYLRLPPNGDTKIGVALPGADRLSSAAD